MMHGIFSNPEWYPKTLSPASRWEDFQAHMHSIYPERCPQPCPAPAPPMSKGELCVASSIKLDFFHSTLTHNNIGGMGPDSGVENMRYSHVGNRTVFNKNEEQTKAFDLIVKASSGYKAQKQETNGLSGSYGIVNLAAPSSTDLSFSFEDSETGEPVTLEAFHFSVFDIDQSKKAQEKMQVGGFNSYTVYPHSEVHQEITGDGRTLFKSTAIGHLCDNPKDPLALGEVTCKEQTVDQRKRAVTFVYADKQNFDVSLEATCSSGTCSGRNFLFAGSSSLSFPCSEEAMLPGMCAIFGDPHFVTFDGAHTVLMSSMPIWLVKSQDVWIQALSKDADGKLEAIAVGGPFLGNKTLIVGKTAPEVVEAYFDGEKILSQERDKFEVSGVVEGHRSPTWNATLHNDDALAVRTQIKFAVGPWPERFLDPVGGLFLFKLPKNVELTITGIDFMSVVLTMPPQADQGGYCGNFNGDVEDDFQPTGLSFHTPIGKDLGAVDSADLLFDPAKWMLGNAQPALLEVKKLDPAKVLEECTEDMKAQAKSKCQVITDAHKREACVFDICATGQASAANAMIAAEILEEKVNSRGIPSRMGKGKCLDAAGREYVAYTAKKLSSAKGCKKILRSLSLRGGVMGAQLQKGSTCQILVQDGADPTEVRIPGGWDSKTNEGASGYGMISDTTREAGWTCWQLL